ncbi:chemotaxis protein CheW [Amphritea balenae]|uniref:Chemotaxis protein CheW n=1 Tax=Amphritea balenae TaxID=452629 RepID=A0A3P1SMJ5_9GAMM|nr:chemotaxis protein CheW [Amphritea balenae]RRC98481.1 purine-binding chemotaxis protein CheW [Amphritea balenae]GGK64825.1 chemotaxis protein CheW [Amphritea balenae]
MTRPDWHSAGKSTGDNTDYDLDQNTEGQQYLSFLLDNEEYGIDILRVQEVRGWTPMTRVPDMPVYLKGVLNLRGAIIPVIDLRERFGLPAVEYGPTTVVIVINVNSGDQQRIMGIIVDAVAETYSLPKEQIQPAPQLGTVINSEFITGLVAQNEQMIVLIDIDELMNADELAIDLHESMIA